jgi:hypothetical protein
MSAAATPVVAAPPPEPTVFFVHMLSVADALKISEPFTDKLRETAGGNKYHTARKVRRVLPPPPIAPRPLPTCHPPPSNPSTRVRDHPLLLQFFN